MQAKEKKTQITIKKSINASKYILKKTVEQELHQIAISNQEMI